LTEISDGRVRDLAHEILARPEYAGLHPSTLESWLVQVIDRIIDWLTSLGGLRVSAPGLFWTIFTGLLLILALMVAQIVAAISAALRAPEPRTSTPIRPLRDPVAEAEQQAAAGDFLEAAHNLMLATFRTLAERSVIELRPDRSNRWIRRALRESKLNDNLIREIDGLVARTERHWFGDRENSPDIYSRWKSAFDQLSRAA
jgi:hypothetical protein